MPKILLILTILLAGVSAFFGFQTKDKIGELKANADSVKQQLVSAQQSQSKAKDELKTVKEQLDSAKEKIAASDAEIASAKAAAEKASSEKTAADAQLASAKNELEQLRANPGTPAIAPDTNAAASADLAIKLKEAEAKYAEAQQLANTLQSKVKEAEDRAESLARKEASRASQLMAKGLEGQVMAVNQGWNFVVVSIGDRQGAVANAQLLVKRGDTMIGKVRITSVEPATSIADIIPDSVARGQRVMPGDRVIYTGQ